MTICIGAICQEPKCVVMASDAMITSEHLSIEFEHTASKLERLSSNCVVATAGDALAYTELFNLAIREIDRLKSPSIEDLVAKVKECYKSIRKRQLIERILEPRGFESLEKYYEAQRMLHPDVALSIMSQIDSYDYDLQLLLGGVDKTGAHLYSIFNPGTSVNFDAIGYHAIGSGLPHAIATLIARDYNQTYSLAKAVFAVYDAKKISEKSPGVGSKITNMAIVSHENIIEFSSEEINEINTVWEKGCAPAEEASLGEIEELLKKSGPPS